MFSFNFYSSLLDGLLNSSIILAITFSVVVPLAYFNTRNIVKYRIPYSRMLGVLSISLLIVPNFIFASIYREFFSTTGPLEDVLSSEVILPLGKVPINSVVGYSFCLMLSIYPLAYAVFKPLQIAHLNSNELIGQTLSLSKWTVFRKITFPFFTPAILFIAIMIISSILGDFTSAQVLGVRTLCTFLFNSWFSTYDYNTLIRYSLIILGLIFLGFMYLLIKSLTRRRSLHFYNVSARSRISISGSRKYLLLFLICLPLIFGLVLPGSVVLKWAIESIARVNLNRLYEFTGESVFISVTVTFISILISFLLILYQRKGHLGRTGETLIWILSAGYVIPSLSLSFLIVWFLGDTSIAVNSKLPNLVLIAQVIKFVGPAVIILNLRSHQIPLQYDMTLSLFRVGPLGRFKNLFVPLFGMSATLASSFVFIESLREVTSPLILRPFTYSTLSVEIFTLISRNLIKESSLLIICLFLCCIYPMNLLIRSLGNENYEK